MKLLPMMVISGVLYFADGTIRLNEGVAAVNSTTVTALVLGLVVTGVGVSHGVSVVVFRVRLWEKEMIVNKNGVNKF